MVVDDHGQVYGWGSIDMELCTPYLNRVNTCYHGLPTKINKLSNVEQIDREAALMKDGSIYTWADSSYRYRKVTQMKDIVKIAGDFILRKDGTVWEWYIDYEADNIRERLVLAKIEGLKKHH